MSQGWGGGNLSLACAHLPGAPGAYHVHPLALQRSLPAQASPCQPRCPRPDSQPQIAQQDTCHTGAATHVTGYMSGHGHHTSHVGWALAHMCSHTYSHNHSHALSCSHTVCTVCTVCTLTWCQRRGVHARLTGGVRSQAQSSVHGSHSHIHGWHRQAQGTAHVQQCCRPTCRHTDL